MTMDAVWLTKKSMRQVCEAPDGWFDRFAINQPDDVRKFGDSNNSTLTFRVSAVLAAVEEGRYFRKRSTAQIVRDAIKRSEAKANEASKTNKASEEVRV